MKQIKTGYPRVQLETEKDRMNKYERDVLTTNGIVGTSCRLQTFGTSLLGLFNRARAVRLWILVARKWQQDVTCF
jgi:hypothetical protein